MDCNKDEAQTAKEIAERKLIVKDIMGARRFALKAQDLYPLLVGMPQLLATIDVFFAAENKVNGEVDWYGILGVSPQADTDIIRKHYRKLLLSLHPDKNKFAGADEAFKFVSDAWTLLSDDAKRAAYNQRRNYIPFNAPAAECPKRAPHKTATRTRTTQSSSHTSNFGAFWTVCHPCKMQYAYHRVYLNKNLLCPNCQEPFLAIETAPPSIISTRASLFWNCH